MRHLHVVRDELDQPMATAPAGRDPQAWTRALEAARRAVLADQLARESHPPAEVGYVEFNRARGQIMDRLDQEAGA